MLIDAAGATHIGLKKEKNEDSFGIFDPGHPGLRLFKKGMLITVADGLGGHIGGDIASKLAVSMMKDMLKEEPPTEEDRGSDREDAHYLDAIENAMVRANDSIFKTNCDLVKGKRPMGTTLCAALIRPQFAYIGNIGDSRGYLFRNGKFIAQTEDHSWIDEQVKLGLMTQEDAEKDKRKNLVTRCIGTHDTIEVDRYKWKIESGDQLLVCTDGLTNMVSDDVIADVLSQPLTTREKADLLVSLANENGGKDNTTLVLALINPTPGALRAMKIRSWFRRHKTDIADAVKLSIFGTLCFILGYVVCYSLMR